MELTTNNKTYKLKKTAKADDVLMLCMNVIEDNPDGNIVEMLQEIRSQYMAQVAPLYTNLRSALEDLGVTQKELAEVLAITPQDVNRRLSGGVKWKPLERRVLTTYLNERGCEYTEEQLFQ